ncbi:MAG TPA: hypothetical protein VMY38_00900 [Gemmatimonadaceae bacterium]|nr:hypothetical protein [Gemmatimonadaceae bacterium]
MGEEQRPALSAEEWIQYADDMAIMADWAADRRPFGPQRRFSFQEKRHAVAAMALHNQPFGFTRDEEAMLESQARFYEHRGFGGDLEIAAKLRRLSRKISALLPPKAAEAVLEKLPE